MFHVVLMQSRGVPELTARLGCVAPRVATVSPSERIPNLDQTSAGHIYVVPGTLLDEPVWARTRVELSQAGRFYVVAGKGC
ncbi:MAG: hypothetical protein KDM81_21300, partial [Verrucomicrobiae bacterium]|nr:hypothetical protein [Verrucomicrobiae bacterium]